MAKFDIWRDWGKPITSTVNMAAIRHESSFSCTIYSDYVETRQDCVVRTVLLQWLYCYIAILLHCYIAILLYCYIAILLSIKHSSKISNFWVENATWQFDVGKGKMWRSSCVCVHHKVVSLYTIKLSLRTPYSCLCVHHKVVSAYTIKLSLCTP